MDNKLIAVIAAAIIVVSGCSIYLVFNDKDTVSRINTSEVAAIYGNANNDYAVDDKDVELLCEIIAGNATWDKIASPLADADQDGAITQADVDLVKKIINNETCDVYYHNYFGDAQKVNFPLDMSRIAVTYWQQAEEMGILGLWDNVVVANESVNGRDNLYDLSNVTFIGKSSGSALDASQVATILEKKVTTIVGSAYDSVRTYADPLVDYGVQTIYLWHSGNYCISTLLTMGVLTGTEDKAEMFLKYWVDLDQKLSDKVPAMADRPSVVIVMNHLDEDNYIKSYGGIFTSVNEPAGEWYLINKLANVFTTDVTGSTAQGRNYYSIDWFIENPFDYMVVMGSGTGATNQAEYDSWFEKISEKYYSQTQEYKNGNILGVTFSFGGFSAYALMPILAWMLYPDSLTYDEALELRQDYYDMFVPLKPDCSGIPMYYLGENYNASYL